MPVTHAQAVRLCTADELGLVEGSLLRSRRLTPADLRRRIEAARRLRDKYRDNGRRQQRDARGRDGLRGPRPATANDNTRRKAQLFGETLARYERRLARLVEPADAEAPVR